MDQELRPDILPSASPSFADRAYALAEVLLAGLAGTLLLSPVLLWGGVSQQLIISDVRVLVAFMLSEATLTMIVLFLLLRMRGESWAALASRPATRKDLRAGVMMVPLLLLTVIVSGLFFQWFLPEWVTEENPILDLLQDPLDFVLMIITSIVVGGIKEELQRAFVLVRFERYLGGGSLGLLCWSVFFGAGHLTQGLDNAIRAALLGLVLGVFFLRRRNPTGPILAHALYDILVVLFAWFYLG